MWTDETLECSRQKRKKEFSRQTFRVFVYSQPLYWLLSCSIFTFTLTISFNYRKRRLSNSNSAGRRPRRDRRVIRGGRGKPNAICLASRLCNLTAARLAYVTWCSLFTSTPKAMSKKVCVYGGGRVSLSKLPQLSCGWGSIRSSSCVKCNGSRSRVLWRPSPPLCSHPQQDKVCVRDKGASPSRPQPEDCGI